MKTEDNNEIYDKAMEIYKNSICKATEVFTAKQLADWFLALYKTFDHEQVITNRLQGQLDVSIIVSHHKLSVIINDEGIHSWLKYEEIISYENLEEDIVNTLVALNFALIKAYVH